MLLPVDVQWKIRVALEPKETQISDPEGNKLTVLVKRFGDKDVLPPEGQTIEAVAQAVSSSLVAAVMAPDAAVENLLPIAEEGEAAPEGATIVDVAAAGAFARPVGPGTYGHN